MWAHRHERHLIIAWHPQPLAGLGRSAKLVPSSFELLVIRQARTLRRAHHSARVGRHGADKCARIIPPKMSKLPYGGGSRGDRKGLEAQRRVHPERDGRERARHRHRRWRRPTPAFSIGGGGGGGGVDGGSGGDGGDGGAIGDGDGDVAALQMEPCCSKERWGQRQQIECNPPSILLKQPAPPCGKRLGRRATTCLAQRSVDRQTPSRLQDGRGSPGWHSWFPAHPGLVLCT